jgi:hypothetical protein
MLNFLYSSPSMLCSPTYLLSVNVIMCEINEEVISTTEKGWRV